MITYNYNPSFPQPEASLANNSYGRGRGRGRGLGRGLGLGLGLGRGVGGASGVNKNDPGNHGVSGTVINIGNYFDDRNRYYTTNNHNSPTFNNTGSFHGSGNGSYYGGGFDARSYEEMQKQLVANFED
ncbi:hypothetical protein PIB30_017587 [Stylosanthes scabra]|uniref:Uncharacterized protein n=1 Tax=Stylosanthes scabra TaxID=79078 RepID=A0ABU6U7Z0_9FABA|nr:hypothetical protein [Stylosanthes scabra]